MMEKNEKHGSHHKQLHVELGREHFATVAKASAEFDTYLRSTLGGQTEADIARLEQTRMDEYSTLKSRMEPSVKSSRSKGKGGRKVKHETDSEESDRDSEDSEELQEQGTSSESESESEAEERVIVSSSKGKKDGRRRK
jgi:hypothetical protein